MSSRLKTLLQRAAKRGVGITRLADGWWVCTGRGGGDTRGPFTRREAIFIASRWALPGPPMTITGTDIFGKTTVTHIRWNGEVKVRHFGVYKDAVP